MGFVAISILDVLYVKRVEKKQNGVCICDENAVVEAQCIAFGLSQIMQRA